MRTRPYIGTLCGIAVGVLAIVIWMLTFEPHGGVELSWYLSPMSVLILKRAYPEQSIPVPLWYGVGFLQWVLIGAFGDLLLRAFRKKGVT